MNTSDLIVGTVAILVGLAAALAAALNWELAYRLWSARRVEQRFGRSGARIFYAILAVLMLLLGVLILAGFGPNQSTRRQDAGSMPHTLLCPSLRR